MNSRVRAIFLFLVLITGEPVSALPLSGKLEQAASAEGRLNTVSMPDNWANWGDTWNDLKTKYGIRQRDTDMNSAQEIARMKAEGRNATIDMGDVGLEFASVAKSQGVTLPYKPATWQEIPVWARDPDGHWMLAYTGTIAFIVNLKKVKHRPTGWKDLLKGKYRVAVGGVGIGSQPTNAVLAAAIGLGGSEANLQPGIELFSALARQKRLSMVDPAIANLEKGEVEVGILWDFNALNYRNQINPQMFQVIIPREGSVTSGYSTIINKWAKHPSAAKLAREYILSDAGQLNLARGYARPIRDIALPREVRSQLLPEEQYTNARPVKDIVAWRKSARELPLLWQDHVLIHLE